MRERDTHTKGKPSHIISSENRFQNQVDQQNSLIYTQTQKTQPVIKATLNQYYDSLVDYTVHTAHQLVTVSREKKKKRRKQPVNKNPI